MTDTDGPGAIFVNYRRQDDPYFARGLYQALREAFDDREVFFDVVSVEAGHDFRERIARALQQSDVVLAVVGPKWLEVRDERGRPRLESPDDWVRVELEMARAQGRRVIPVRAEGARMPSWGDLPVGLRWFASCNALRVTNERYDADVAWLVEQVRRALAEAAEARRAGFEPAQGHVDRRLTPDHVRRAEALADWDFIKQSEDPGDFRDHVERFPGAETARLARRRLEELSRPVAGSERTTMAGTMVWVPGGTFDMGSPESEAGRGGDEGPVHRVTVSGLWVMKGQVSQGLYEDVTGTNPSLFASGGRSCPVERVSWLDAVEFANRLSESEAERLTPAYRIDGEEVSWDRKATGYRLLTEAEWEYGARGGEAYVYAGSNEATAVGWIDANSGGETHPCCDKPANGFGLCDMTGNVFDWVWDWFSGYSSGAQQDPSGPASGAIRVFRGGSWINSAQNARVANRNRGRPGDRGGDVGFRLARPAP